MPEFTINQHIDAPVEQVWAVLNKFGDISAWNSGVKASHLTSTGPVDEGSTRHCAFVPLGVVEERIRTYVPGERMTIDIFETSKLPISSGVADFAIAAEGKGTQLTLHYSYELNRLGRFAKSPTDKQMRKGLGGLVRDLTQESERLAVAS